MNSCISKLGFGTASMTSLFHPYQVQKLLLKSYELGIRHFDTAPLYGKGYAEALVGNFIKSINRKEVTITTKFGLGFSPKLSISPNFAMPLNFVMKRLKGATKNPISNNSLEMKINKRKIERYELEQSIEKSLERLKCSYIDYFFLHEALPDFLTEEALLFILGLKKDGIVRKIGIASNSNYIHSLNENQLFDWQVLQYEFEDTKRKDNLMQKHPNKEHFIHSCIKKNIEFDSAKNLNAFNVIKNVMEVSGIKKVIFSTRSIKRLESNLINTTL